MRPHSQPKTYHTMKPKNPRDFLQAAVALIGPEEQQAAREAIKAGVFTPVLAAALAVKLDEATREAHATPVETGLTTKVDLLTNALRSVEQRLKEVADNRATSATPKADAKLEETISALRDDMRGMQDGLAALRPYHRSKIVWVLVAVLLLGAAAGWYGRIEYRTWQNERMERSR
jgi:hypothetical protein